MSFCQKTEGGNVMKTNMKKYFTFITNRFTHRHDAYDKMLP